MNNFYKGGRGLCLPEKNVETQCIASLPQNQRNQDVPQNIIGDIRRGEISFAQYGRHTSTRKRANNYSPLPLLIFICCLFNNVALAQSPDPREAVTEVVVPLRVGDYLPEEFWTREHLFYTGTDTVWRSLSDYKGKWIILDFWATWCGPCLHSFFKLDQIREIFSEKCEIILVNQKSTKNGLAKISETYHATKGKLWKADIPTIVYDEYLGQLFPHIGIPFYVWIHPNGSVYSYTRAPFVGINEVYNVIYPSI